MLKLKLPDNQNGVTLAEAMIGAGVLLLVMGGIMTMYVSGTKMWDNASEQIDLEAQAREALNAMTAELRQATRTSTQNPSPNAVIPKPGFAGNNSMRFYLPADVDGNGLITDANGNIEWGTNNSIDYQYNSGTNKLERVEGGVTAILANNVSSLSFNDINTLTTLARNEIKIVLTLTKTTIRRRVLTVTLSTVVKLRN